MCIVVSETRRQNKYGMEFSINELLLFTLALTIGRRHSEVFYILHHVAVFFVKFAILLLKVF